MMAAHDMEIMSGMDTLNWNLPSFRSSGVVDSDQETI